MLGDADNQNSYYYIELIQQKLQILLNQFNKILFLIFDLYLVILIA
jgi:hypothetical protein